MSRIWLDAGSEAVTELDASVRTGDVETLTAMLAREPDLAVARIRDADGESWTSLHLTVRWPGHFPHGPAIALVLLAAGADPDARCEGGHPETALHWAATADDAEMIDTLLDGGAGIDAVGAAVGNGTALDNAVGYGCWLAAHRLVQRGAQVTKAWHAAALGMTARLDDLLGSGAQDVDNALWHACRGGQRRTVERLLDRGGDLAWVPPYDRRSAAEVLSAQGTRRKALADWLRSRLPVVGQAN